MKKTSEENPEIVIFASNQNCFRLDGSENRQIRRCLSRNNFEQLYQLRLYRTMVAAGVGVMEFGEDRSHFFSKNCENCRHELWALFDRVTWIYHPGNPCVVSARRSSNNSHSEYVNYDRIRESRRRAKLYPTGDPISSGRHTLLAFTACDLFFMGLPWKVKCTPLSHAL